MYDFIPVDEQSFAASISAPSVKDLQLAEALGYERPSNIRNLIKRHSKSLEAMGTLLQREAMIETANRAHRSVKEYHLNEAQTAFVISKSGTRRADSVMILMAEIFTMARKGALVAADATAEAQLVSASDRELERQRAIHREEKEARSDAFRMLSRGRRRSGSR